LADVIYKEKCSKMAEGEREKKMELSLVEVDTKQDD
jgi:hypothetical protein